MRSIRIMDKFGNDITKIVDIVIESNEKSIENTKTQNSDYIMHLDESTLWTKKIKSKKIGKPFFSLRIQAMR